MSNFRPKMYQKNIFHINYEKLKEIGIKLIVLDLDNTILKVDEVIPSEEVKEFVTKLKKDFQIVIASNNMKERVGKVANYLECDKLYSIRKPSKKIKKFLDKRYKVPMNQVAIIGDQIMTDIFMGNRLKMYTILVDPIGTRDLKVTYFNRLMEKMVLRIMKFKRQNYYE